MSNLIAVQGCQLTVMPPSTGVATITSSPETDVSIENKPAYFGTMTVSVSGAATTGADSGAGVGILNGSSLYSSNNGKKAIVFGDSVQIEVTGKQTSYPFNPIAWVLQVKITNAGQTSTTTD